MTITIVAIANNGDTTYTITFSGPVANTDPGNDHTQLDMLLWSPGDNRWEPVITNAAEIGNTIVVTSATAAADATQFVQLDQPVFLDPGGGNSVETAAPQTAVT